MDENEMEKFPASGNSREFPPRAEGHHAAILDLVVQAPIFP
jgi:hypothetical protein